MSETEKQLAVERVLVVDANIRARKALDGVEAAYEALARALAEAEAAVKGAVGFEPSTFYLRLRDLELQNYSQALAQRRDVLP